MILIGKGYHGLIHEKDKHVKILVNCPVGQGHALSAQFVSNHTAGHGPASYSLLTRKAASTVCAGVAMVRLPPS